MVSRLEDIEEELALPDELTNVSVAVKRELLDFKRNHNEVTSSFCITK